MQPLDVPVTPVSHTTLRPQQSPTPVPIFSIDSSRVRGGRKHNAAAPLSNQISGDPHHHKAPKSAALKALYDIAGKDWDPSRRLDKSLNAVLTKFKCPAAEGHFPDPEDCGVYYQCAHGASTRYDCTAGLKWNVASNQCDWEANVDCGLNRKPGTGGGAIFRYYKY